MGARALAIAVRSSSSPPRKSQPNAISTFRVQRTVTSAPSVSADHESSAAAAVGELIGDGGLGRGAGEREVRADTGGRR